MWTRLALHEWLSWPLAVSPAHSGCDLTYPCTIGRHLSVWLKSKLHKILTVVHLQRGHALQVSAAWRCSGPPLSALPNGCLTWETKTQVEIVKSYLL
jgi:hypothetical protein